MKITTKTAHMRTTRKGFTLVELLVVIAIIAALAGVSYGPIMKQIGAADRSEAIANGKNINIALLSYYSKNREYPSGSTITSAESAFQELLNTEEVDDEKYFWNKSNANVGLASTDGVDNDLTLTADENVWAYNEGLDAGDGSSPLIFDACASGTAGTSASFLANVWGGQAIIVRVDGSATAEDITFTLPQGGIVDGTVGPVENQNGVDIFAGLSSTAVTTYVTTAAP